MHCLHFSSFSVDQLINNCLLAWHTSPEMIDLLGHMHVLKDAKCRCMAVCAHISNAVYCHQLYLNVAWSIPDLVPSKPNPDFYDTCTASISLAETCPSNPISSTWRTGWPYTSGFSTLPKHVVNAFTSFVENRSWQNISSSITPNTMHIYSASAKSTISAIESMVYLCSTLKRWSLQSAKCKLGTAAFHKT